MDWNDEIVSVAKECLELNQALERITLEQADMEAQRIKKHEEWKDARDRLSRAFVKFNALTKYNRQWVDSSATRTEAAM